ncbi:arrestin domain protein [Opisthorchis viverrini]|uniref:Arrestin domain protein n=2 Tax=Opisthorchis viverrini TaxID=6198 RepID=A0A1S8WRP3_OPIVI|nr:hypothetical protein T265_04191 [Opisthorchis viverrini]KER29098.1 hypothetical protein T265_04191 [Opisthorchis viverrini]OON17136.1 arrestin domain protein [Opisthorchis viverrini]
MSTKRSVYKKNSPSDKLAVYLSARDIFDDLENVDPIEGVVTTDMGSLRESKLFARIRCTFRYGEQSMDDVLSGVAFFKEFLIETVQLYPSEDKKPPELSDVQKRLMERFGENAIPFRFTLPHDIPASITIQSEPSSVPVEHPCGIEYMLQVFIGRSATGNVSKKNSISMAIRRLTLAIPDPNSSPYTKEIVKNFHFHSGMLKATVTLTKEVFYHGEPIQIILNIDNLSSNSVRRVKFQFLQCTELTMFKQRTDRFVVLEMESDEGFPVPPQSKEWQHKYSIRPSIQDARVKAGLALDGKLKHEDTTLASSTLIKDFRKKEAMAMVVQYAIRVKLCTGFGGRDVEADIPVILTHKRSTPELVKAEAITDLIISRFKRNKARNRRESDDV